ncbi:hypothetical protein DPMN_014063 [Dreissena polymorpha]|uniref:Uncharacterized protein n=1 Tax=Dreissena polymorpha TaxID=45954 RepID=A0A9D4S342_DREPO|nr:hypothetical protein DPMN_014063 [Dreissena polymorpha]
MSGTPHDMCLITPCQVAVAMGSRIQIVSVISGQLVNDRWLYLPHECRGVAHLQGYLYVTSGSALYKYNLTGTLVKKMYVGTSDSGNCHEQYSPDNYQNIYQSSINPNVML